MSGLGHKPIFSDWHDVPVEKFVPRTQGYKADADKVRHDLLPIDALTEVSKVLTFGARKYNDRNWEKGIQYNRLFRAAIGHLWDWWRRAPADEETGLSHLAHAACCVLFLLAFECRKTKESELDNRPHVGSY